jgi:hydrogenase maturation protein HypF
MKLEAVAADGRPAELEPVIKEEEGITTLDQSNLLLRLAELSLSSSVEDVAATAQQALARGMAEIALEIAERENVETVGFSGGVAYNDAISRTTESVITEAGRRFVTNSAVPVGDGGVSLGQLRIAAGRKRNG